MCALRDYRKIPAVSLACQNRLDQTPRRPVPKKVTRKKKQKNDITDEQQGVENIIKGSNNTDYEYHYLQRLSNIGYDEWEEFDFDGRYSLEDEISVS